MTNNNINYNQVGNNQPEKVTIFRRLSEIGKRFSRAFVVGQSFVSGQGLSKQELKTYATNQPQQPQSEITIKQHRGAKQGQRYSNPTPNKYIYRRGYGSKPRKLGLNPAWVKLYGNDANLRKYDASMRRLSPSSRRFSRVAKGITRSFLPEAENIYAYPEYNLPKGQLTLEEGQQLAEAELYQETRQLSGYEQKLLKSIQYYNSRQLRKAHELARAKYIRQLQAQINMQSQMLNAPSSVKVPENERINITENIFSASNPNYLNLMKKRFDSIDIMHATNVMNASGNILNAPRLNFGLVDPTQEQI